MRCLHGSDFSPNAGRLRQGHGLLIKDSYATVWSGVEPGMSAVVQAETWRLNAALRSFYFPHEQHIRRENAGYLSFCGHVCDSAATVHLDT